MLHSWWRNPFFICFIVLLSYGITLCGAIVPLTGDQKVYLSTALEIFKGGNWVVPTLFGDPNFLKPPFQYWATVVGWKIFGISLFGAFLPSVIALSGSVFFSFRIAKKLDLSQPSLAALLTASTLGSMTYGTTAQMEIWIVFFLLGSWLSVLHGRIFLTFLLVGIMAWVKGPLYPALFTFSLLFWKPQFLSRVSFWASLLTGVFIGLGWYGAVSITHYRELMSQFFEVENVGKMATSQGTMYGLWGEFFFSLFPWSAFVLIGALQSSTRKRWKTNLKFFLAYSVFSAVFFSFFPYRVNTYLYFLTPIMAMLVSELDFELTPRIRRAVMVVHALVFVAMLFVIFHLAQNGWIHLATGAGFALASALFLLSIEITNRRLFALSSLMIVVLVRVMAIDIGSLEFGDLKTFDREHRMPLAYYHEKTDIWHEFGMVSATLKKPVTILTDIGSMERFLASGGAVILQDDQNFPEWSAMKCSDWKRLKRRTKFPFTKLIREGLRWGDPEIMRTFRICFQST